MASARSNTVTSWPALRSWAAAARPDGPDPTMATRRPESEEVTFATGHPLVKACSAISYSTRSMVTGSLEIPSTQADSHGAGQSRPVNSGKLFVAKS